MEHTPRNGKPPLSASSLVWTQPEAYFDDSQLGTPLLLRARYGDLTKELMTIVSASMMDSPDLRSELSRELQDIWPMLQAF